MADRSTALLNDAPHHPWNCPWLGCSATCSADESKSHISNHLNTISEEWSGATACEWPKCTSKALFKTAKLLANHTLNVHVEPLVCTVPSCSHKKPFGKKCDLLRHIRTIHTIGLTYKCRVHGCDANVTGFSRRDKMLQHMREMHTLLKCGYNHCSAEVLEAETASHLQQSHGNLECAIGDCKNAHKSYFRADSLLKHLRTSHSIPRAFTSNMLLNAQLSADKTVLEHFGPGEGWKACKSCST